MDNEIELDDKGMPVLPSNRRWVVDKRWTHTVSVTLEEFCYSKGIFRKEDVYIPLQIDDVWFNPEDTLEEIDRLVKQSALKMYKFQVESDELLRQKAKERAEAAKKAEKKKQKVDQYLDKYWGRSR